MIRQEPCKDADKRALGEGLGRGGVQSLRASPTREPLTPTREIKDSEPPGPRSRCHVPADVTPHHSRHGTSERHWGLDTETVLPQDTWVTWVSSTTMLPNFRVWGGGGFVQNWLGLFKMPMTIQVKSQGMCSRCERTKETWYLNATCNPWLGWWEQLWLWCSCTSNLSSTAASRIKWRCPPRGQRSTSEGWGRKAAPQTAPTLLRSYRRCLMSREKVQMLATMIWRHLKTKAWFLN